MMRLPIVISSAKSFVAWLKRQPDERPIVFGRLLRPSRRLLLHAVRNLNGQEYPEFVGHSGEIVLTEIELPAISHAQSWWKNLWALEICDFRACMSHGRLFVSLCSGANWAVLPELYLSRPKSEHRTINNKRAIKILGDERYKEMCREAFELGFSARLVAT